MGWLAGYAYRQKIPLKRVGGAVSDYQMKLTAHKGAGASSGADVYLKNHALSWTGTVPNDIRFTNLAGNELDYWIESSDANTAIVWIEFDSIGTTDTDFYIYYGKSGDTTTSAGDDTFPFFDDFPGSSIDTNKWDSAGTVSVTGSEVTLLRASSVDAYIVFKNSVNMTGLICEAKAKSNMLDAGRSDYNIMNGQSEGASGYISTIYTDQDGDGNKIGWNEYDGNWGAEAHIFFATPNTYYIWRLYKNGASFSPEVLDLAYSSQGTVAARTLSDVAIYAFLDARWADTQNWVIDWVRVRNYADPEPTWGTWGAEETSVKARSFGYIMG